MASETTPAATPGATTLSALCPLPALVNGLAKGNPGATNSPIDSKYSPALVCG